jgi:hypothetical protein
MRVVVHMRGNRMMHRAKMGWGHASFERITQKSHSPGTPAAVHQDSATAEDEVP